MCVQSRAPDTPHTLVPLAADATPVVCIDYSFFFTGDEDDAEPPVLIGHENLHGYGFAAVSERKGRSDALPVSHFIRFLQEA